MGKNKKRLRIVLLLIILVGVYLLWDNTVKEPKEADLKFNKVLLIGIDGMDHKITQKLMELDKLPHFSQLAKQGSFQKLETSNPSESPVAWVSISTGLNPGKHNIFDFIRRNAPSQMPELSLSKTKSGIGGTKHETYVRGKPFWKLTSEANIDTTVIRWPVTFPPEKVEGKMLSGLGIPDVKGLLSGYTFYTTKDTSSEDKGKVVKVAVDNGLIKTTISGPRIKKGDRLEDVTVPMMIELGPEVIKITVDGETYNVPEKQWSPWMKASFKTGFMKKISGIFKVYLNNIEPFEMYLTTVQPDPANPLFEITYPSSYSSKLAKEIGTFYTLGMPEETDGFINDRLDAKAFLEQTAQVEEERSKMFWKEFANFQKSEKGVYAFVFDTSDRLQHVFWREKVLENDDGKISLSKPVLDYYLEKDRFLGEVMERLDDQTLLLIISDHGITSFERAVNINNWLVENGLMSLKKELGSGEESPLFQYVDWSNTKAYSLGFSSIYVNLKNREGDGIVEDREKIVDEIVLKLEQLTDPKNGNKVVNKVYRREEIYHGDYLKNAPDIIIGFNPGYRMSWQTAVGGFGPEVITDNEKKWDGDHLVDPKFVPGILFSNQNLQTGPASLIDIAPTVLDALGVEVPKEIDGRSLIG